jgi:hypothetical protein
MAGAFSFLADMRAGAGFKLLYWLLAALHLWPIWESAWFVTVDGPCHLANARILLDLVRGDEFTSRFFALHAWPEPYWTGPLIMAAVMSVAPAWVAEKAVFSLAVIAVAWSYRRLAVSLAPERPWLSLLGMPFLLHYAAAMGFINFCLSLPLLLMALHCAWHQPQASMRPYPVRLGLILTVLFFTHLTSFMVAGACIALMLLLRDRGEGRSGLLGLRIAALAAVPGVCLTLAYLLLHPTARGGATWVPLGDRLAWLVNGRAYNALGVDGEFYASALTAAPVALLGAWVLIIGWKKGRTVRTWLLLAACALAAFLVLPDVAAGGSSASPRALLFFMLLLSLAITASEADRALAIVAVAVVMAGDIWHTALQARTARVLAHEAGALLEAAVPIGDAAVVLPLNYSGNWVHSNLSSYIAATRNATVLDNFVALAPFSPVQWRPESLPHGIGDFATSNAPCVTVEEYERLTGVPITHVLFWKSPAESPDSCTTSTLEQVSAWQRAAESSDALLFVAP